jgi:3-deoxy-D-manno-octulosonic-acid transferase
VRERAPLPLPGILPLVVAGSTWPDDEAVLLPALEALRDRGVCLALALAPHEVGERRLEKLEGALEAAGFTPVRWSRNAEAELSVDGDFSGKAGAGLFPKKDRPVGPSAAPAPRDAEARALRGLVGSSGFPPSTEARTAADALVIDRVGLLYRLYFGAAAAYVGGGFGGALHNVMEPAVFGVPVVTGPRTRRSWIAREMVRAGGLFPVADPSACAAVLEHLLAGGPSAVAAGRRARDVLAAHGGATERTLEALREAGWLAQGDTAAATPPKKWSGGTLSS